MEKLIETRAAFPFLLRPGGTAMLCGLILFGMGAYVYRWDQLQKAGPAKDSLVRVQATLLAANCESTRSGSTVYGRPQVQYSYMYGGNTFKGDRYYSEWKLQLGTLPQCEAAMKQMMQLNVVDAWVDPKHPNFSVLSKSESSPFLTQAFMGLGGALALLGLIRFWHARRRGRRLA